MTRNLLSPLFISNLYLFEQSHIHISECSSQSNSPTSHCSGPVGFVEKRVDQIDKQSQHCSQCSQNKISHTIIVGIVRHPLPTVPSHRPLSSVFVFLISVPLCLSPPQCRAEQSTGAFVKPLLFLLQFPPN